jgi:hypothetical protein
MSADGGALVDLASQKQAMLTYVNANGPVSELQNMTDPMAAAQLFSQQWERPAQPGSDIMPGMVQSI